MTQKENPADSSATQYLQELKDLIEQGKYQDALRPLSLVFSEDPGLAESYHLAVMIMKELNGETEEKLFQAALDDFDNFTPFYDLGYHFVDTGNFDLARPFLERAYILGPDEIDVAYELSLCYMARFSIDKALDTLESVDSDSDFWASYMMWQCRLWTNQPGDIDEYIKLAREFLFEQEESEEIVTAMLKLDELEESCLRHGQLEAPGKLIRDWHFIQYGSVVLDYFDESDDYVAGGRYVAMWGALESLRTTLEALKVYLQTMRKLPARILAPADRDSRIVGSALSSILNVPCLILTEDTLPTEYNEPTLIVAGDAGSFNDWEQLRELKPNCTLFAVNLNWMHEALICPDIAAYMTQAYWFPWQEGGMKIDDQGNAVPQQADERPVEEVAADLTAAPVQLKENFVATMNFYKNVADFLKGGPRGGTRRHSFRVDSPVPGAYFC